MQDPLLELDPAAMDTHLRQTMSSVLGQMQNHQHLTVAAAAAAAQQGSSGLQGAVPGNGYGTGRQGETLSDFSFFVFLRF